MNTILTKSLEALENKAKQITTERKQALAPLIEYITAEQLKNETVQLIFVCIHNSRRSHMAQMWAIAAARYANLDNIECYSGGTEVTCIHPNTVAALKHSGIQIEGEDDGDNPLYLANFGEALMTEVYSKRYDDDSNPSEHFVAVMVCAAAAEACPYVSGADVRLSLPFEDPKEFDGDNDPLLGYIRRSEEIGAEMLYVMTSVSNSIAE